jgi:predicted dehydrogenase
VRDEAEHKADSGAVEVGAKRSRDAEGVNVGIVGCGVISKHYAANAEAFDAFDLVACADLLPTAAEELAAAHELTALPVADLLADPGIEVVLNLTPSSEHAGVTRAALAAGKHVYTEKPLGLEVGEATELLAEADRRGVRIGCAPDIFLGGAYQAARELIDEGAIGEPLAVSAAMLLGGADAWHPSPEQFFQDGAGPLLDMGPYYFSAIVALLGPIRRVAGFAAVHRPERRIMVGPRAGEEFPVLTPTHTSATMELDGGVIANLVASFDATDRYVCDFFVHGTGGDLSLPDPNAFEGQLRIRRRRGRWQKVPYLSRGACEARGLGLADMAEAIAEDGDHRATGQLGLHVVDVARSILRSAENGRAIAVRTDAARPAPLPVGASAAR